MKILEELKFTSVFNEIFILVTNKCNLRCKHCYVSSGPDEPIGLSLSKLFEIIDAAVELNNSIRIVLSGGEVMLRKKDVLEIIERYSNNYILILSNGMFFTSDVSKILTKYPNVHIRISIDGYNKSQHDYIRGNGSFLKVISGINNLMAEGFNRISISTTVSELSTESIPDILNLTQEIGIKSVKIEPIAKTGRAVDYFGTSPQKNSDSETKKFRDFIAKNNKIGHWQHKAINETKYDIITVYSNGDVYPYTFYNDHDQKFGLVGNIFSNSLIEIVTSPNWQKSIMDNVLRFSFGPDRSMGAFNYDYKL